MKTKKPTEKPNIKKVKIDEHIKTAKGSVNQNTPRKRGRPRKDRTESNGGSILQDVGSGSSGAGFSDAPIDHASDLIHQPSIVEPIYDTTEEAKGVLRAPFDIAAGLTGIAGLALTPSQIDALAPSFKVVYDRRIAPYMGDNADLIAFGMVFAGVAFQKVQIFRDEMEKRRPTKKETPTESAGSPFIPTEHHA